MLLTFVTILYFTTIAIVSVMTYKLIGKPNQNNRNKNIDGLRGILATMVVLFHFLATYRVENNMGWTSPDSILLSNIGPVAVSLFFIISGFLFFDLIYKDSIDWKGFFVARIFRVYPLYIVTILIVCIFSFILGDNTDFSGVFYWLVFLWAPIFGYNDSYLLNSGVQWTLLYEMSFYAMLPLLWAMKHRKMTIYLLISLCSAFSLLKMQDIGFINISLFTLFLIGAACNLIIRKLQKYIYHYFFSVIGVLCLFVAFFFTSPYTYFQSLFLMMFFIAMSGGSGLLNILGNKYFVSLGAVSYSIYIIHGIVLFSIYRTDFISLKGMVFPYYLLMFPVLMVIVCALSVVTYKVIENPSIKFGVNIINKINNRKK